MSGKLFAVNKNSKNSKHNKHNKSSANKKSRCKKAQMEMVGLVVIVILITLGILFMAQFALKEKPEKKIFTRKGLAYSATSAVIKMTIPERECVPGSISGKPLFLGKDILEDCAVNHVYPDLESCGYSCKYSCRYGEEALHSCDFFSRKAGDMLIATLGQWNKNYELNVLLMQEEEVIPLLRPPVSGGEGCRRNKDRDSSGPFPLQLSGIGLVKSELHLCD